MFADIAWIVSLVLCNPPKSDLNRRGRMARTVRLVFDGDGVEHLAVPQIERLFPDLRDRGSPFPREC